MSLSFPASPTVGQIYQNWIWSGSAWNPVGASVAPIGIKTFTASGQYVPNPALVCAVVECVGGGGGGQGAGSGNYAGVSGGGAGGYSRRFLMASQIGAQQTVTIGAGGAAGASGGGAGGNGGQTSFGSLCIANGGNGGPNAANNYAGGVGASPGVGDVALPGGDGGAGSSVAPGSGGGNSGIGGASAFGTGGAGIYAPGGWGVATGAIAARVPGSGGGGSASASSAGGPGGAGAPGACIVTEYVSTSPLILPPNTITSGNRVLLATNNATAGSTQVVMTGNYFTSLYDEYELDWYGVQAQGSTDASLILQVATAGPTWHSGANDYSFGYALAYSSAAGAFQSVSTSTWLTVSSGNTTNPLYGPSNGLLRLSQAAASGVRKQFRWTSNGYQTTNGFVLYQGAGGFNGDIAAGGAATGPLAGLLFSWAPVANFASGTFKLYGIQK